MTVELLASARRRYEDWLWWTMRRLGVDESVERKIVTAVGIQFLVSVTQALLPFLVSGRVRYALAAALFVAAAVALANTLLVVRRDFVEPIRELKAQADAIAAGTVDGEPIRIEQADEIGGLAGAFGEMRRSLRTVSEQAAALARQDFDDPVLDEEVPGAFGRSLRTMTTNLVAYTDDLEAMTDRLERRSERLEELVCRFGEATDRAREGDLTATLDGSSLADDEELYRAVIEGYNDLVATLGDTIREVQAFGTDVSEASDEVAAAVDEVDEASDEVADSIQEISAGAAEQTERLRHVASEMDALSATVEEIAASADSAAETADDAARRGRSGRESVATAIAELDDVEESIRTTATAVEGLAEQIDEINEIASFIDGIAEETNMLALNASIEAARAGEDGDGFAVVADEVKTLAEETRDSAGDISARIADVQAESESTVEDVRSMERSVSESVATIESALSDFEGIVDVVEDLNATIQEISDATDEGAETTQEVVDLVDEVARISEETSSEAENVAAAAQQQTASISEVTTNVRSLSRRADELRAALDRFTVPDADGDAGAAAAGHGPVASTTQD